MQTRKNAVLLAFMMILTSLLLLVSLSANITHAAEKGSTLNGQTQQFNKGEGNPNSKDSKSDSEEATPSKGTNSEDNSTTQSDHTANVTINKIASDTQKQLAGAHLQILDKNGKVVQDFTTNGEASVFNLPKGEYTIKEVSAPEGYDVANQQFTVNDENVTTTIGTTVRAGTGDTGNKIYVDSIKEEIYIDSKNNQKDLGYCFNISKHYPDDPAYYDNGVSYDRTSISDGSSVNKYMRTPRQENDEDSLKAIRTIIWNGFASNPDNIQKKYGLTDDELYRITQRAIWYYTDKGPLNLGMANNALDRHVTDEELLKALQDMVKVDPNSPIPNGMTIDFFTPDNDSYQNILAASFTSTSTKPGKPVTVTLVDKPKPNTPTTPEVEKPHTEKPHTPEVEKPHTPEVEKPKATTPTTPEVEQPKANTPTTPEVVQPKATEQPSDNTATQKNNDDDFYAIPVKAQTTDKKAKVNHQKAVYKANNSQKMPKATSVVYTANNSEALPKTGAKQSALIVLIGLGMVVLSGFLYKKEF
ncbi:thioester-forming surface-anchored protein [Lactobacillus crispatus]|nr:thioester-forming surface-anchored protein [Lactobacillus crispatus]OXC24764.1 hypothetical protein AYP83_08850 [Lactobacillus crispatus]